VVLKDLAEAVKWYRKSANQGLAVAQYNLGDCYLLGDGVAKDSAEAIKWYSKAAEQGDELAQFNLGWLYYNGYSVSQDLSKAVMWYRKSANQGFAKAQLYLGLCYVNGEGITKNPIEGYGYLSLASISNQTARENRDLLEKQMPTSQIEAGKKRSTELQAEIEANKKNKR
jgi:TPR repeat protein